MKDKSNKEKNKAKAENILSGDIVDIALSSRSFKTFVAALTTAGFVETLKGEGPFTVFAPSDAAFAKLPTDTVESLLKPEVLSKLKAIFTHHVIAGRLSASEVVKLESAKTVHGRELGIHVGHSNVRVNNSKVVQTDIIASNGVIHVIDDVLMP